MKKIATLMAGIVLAVPAFAYTITMSDPATERAYIFPAQNIDVAVQVKPAMTTEHTLLIVLDETTVATNQMSVSLPTAQYGLGNHTLRAILYDDSGREIAKDERVIYIMPKTNLAKEREDNAARQAAYNALPWYQKLYFHARQGNMELKIDSAQPSSGVATDPNGNQIQIVRPISSGVPTLVVPTK